MKKPREIDTFLLVWFFSARTVGPSTWNKLYNVFWSIQEAVPPTHPSPEPEPEPVPPTPTPPPSQIFPGTLLRIGSRGEDVRLMQTYLNAISKVFPSVPALTADGIFGANTQNSVVAFQWLFGLTPDGIIGEKTWNKVVEVYNSLPNVAAPQYPGTSLRVGSRGNDVIIMQKYLNAIAQYYPEIPPLIADGIFGPMTERSVIAFQNLFGLTPDGIIGRNTWNLIVSVYNKLLG